MNSIDFIKYINPSYKGHLVGIGGVSMAPLAEVLWGSGIKITGSDISDSASVEHLRSLGINIAIGHRAENIGDADFVVRTAAARDDNPEIMEAHRRGIPVFERAQAWGAIMKGYENALCIAGTHGKTTTTSMATHILMAANEDPTVMIGGTLPLLHANHHLGHGDTIILESCEYYNSFLSFFPTIAVILNVDADHLDYFKNLDAVKESFRNFAALVPESGHIICNGDDKNTMDALAPLGRPLITFGMSEKCSIRAVNIHDASTGFKKPGSEFDIMKDGKIVCRVHLKVPGHHNVMNALAAAAAALTLNIPAEYIDKGLANFTGAGRRFEYKGTYNGALVYDDYAHHPSELRALLDMVLALDYERVIVAFQPHTYTRTKLLFDEFVQQLRRPTKVFLAEIYAAREKNTIGISSKDLTDKIDGAVFCKDFDELEKALMAEAKPGDIILTVGAGNIYTVGENIVKKGLSC